MVIIVLIVLVAAIIISSYMNRKENERREWEHERRQARFDNLMNLLSKEKNEDDKETESDKNKDI